MQQLDSYQGLPAAAAAAAAAAVCTYIAVGFGIIKPPPPLQEALHCGGC